MEKNILFGSEGRKKAIEGINTTADAVRVTLGARGRNVAIVTEGGGSITKDGVTVVRSIRLDDPIERFGSRLVQEVAHKTLVEAGDSTTTASILFQELVKYGSEFLEDKDRNINVNELNRGISDGVKFAVGYIKEKSQPISGSLDLLKNIATIAANNDKALGTIIAKAVNSAGENGRVSVVESATPETSYKMVEGFQYNRGYLAAEFVTNKKRNLCVLEDAFVLISERPLLQMKPLLPILEQIAGYNEQHKKNHPVLVIAPEIDMEALALLVGNHANNVLQICAVQCPGQGNSMEAYTTDLSVYVGAMVISEERNIKLESATLQHLGMATRVEVGPREITIIGGQGDETELQTRVESLKSLAESTTDPNEKQTINDRISSITCGVAILSVGAGSATEGREKVDRVDDALKACKSANEEGYVAGSGATFNGACFEIPLSLKEVVAISAKQKMHQKEVTDYQRGLYCVYMAIQSISKQISKNAGKEPYGDVNPPQMYKDSYGRGYDAKADEICNLIERGIIDPAKVLRVALQNAASVATTFLTTEVVNFVK